MFVISRASRLTVPLRHLSQFCLFHQRSKTTEQIVAVALGMGIGNKDAEQMLTTSNNQFTAKMFSEVVRQSPRSSVVLSAFSVLTPLAQLALATEGGSRDELLRTIGLSNDKAIKDVFAVVNSKVRSIKGVDLKMASRIYVALDAEVNDNFQALSRDTFGSDVKNVDFSKNAATAQVINSWVEDQTNKRIKDLVSPDSIDYNTRAVLVNAIYFKGTWKNKFNPEDTEERDFFVSKEQKIQLPTMYRKGKYLYGESEELDAKLLRIPYEGEQSSMLIILPNEIEGLAALEEKLKNPNAIHKATQDMNTFDVDVFLPKFRIETTTNLKSILEAIGLKKIFQPGQAQLHKLLKEKSELYISDAIQKAFIEVNEEGAEAAAANVLIAFGSSMMITSDPEFKADHPFIFILSDGDNALFSGVFYA